MRNKFHRDKELRAKIVGFAGDQIERRYTADEVDWQIWEQNYEKICYEIYDPTQQQTHMLINILIAELLWARQRIKPLR